MLRLRLRTKFLLSLVLVTTLLTVVTLLIIHRRAEQQAREATSSALRNSLTTFQNFQKHREASLERSAELLADLPILRALMTSNDEATIQDGSRDLWRLAGSDLLVLGDRTGKLMALQTSTSGFTRAAAVQALERTLASGETRDWWFGGGRLYEVFLRPIYFGPASHNTLLGVLAVGYEIDEGLANDIGRIAAGHVAFRYKKRLVVTTLPADRAAQLGQRPEALPEPGGQGPAEIQIGGERFVAAAVDLPPAGAGAVSLTVFESYDQATAFLRSLNRLLLGVGLAAVIIGSILIFLISYRFTRPLGELVSGVRALEKGDFAYPLAAQGGDEAAELTRAFDRMRQSLKKTQEELIHAERLATVGRMASSISHDLRHPLSTVLAYSEFLSEPNVDALERQEHYQEVRSAVNQMTDLIASLLEFSRTRQPVQLIYGSIDETLKRVVQTVLAREEFRQITVTLACGSGMKGWYDPKKVERVFQNLLLNACEAVPPDSGKIEAQARQIAEGLEITVADNGPGIPEEIREKLFQPFVSHGKSSGTGLGLAVVQKIIQDLGGGVSVESRPGEGAVFRVVIPLNTSIQEITK